MVTFTHTASSKNKWAGSGSATHHTFHKGDHLVSSRTGYTHHGLYVGHDQVLHYAGLSDGLSASPIELISVSGFSNRRKVQVIEHVSRKYSRSESVERAYSRLGEDRYNVAINNCEHFVTWCITGANSSAQVNHVVSTAAFATMVAKIPNAQVVDVVNQILSKVVGYSGRPPTRITSDALVEMGTASSKRALVMSPGWIAGSGAGLATGGLSAGLAGLTMGLTASAATIAAPLLAGAVVGYGVKKLVNWMCD